MALLRRRNSASVEVVVGGLRALGRLETLDAGWVATARTTAAALDAAGPDAPPGEVATLARAHLRALERLVGAGSGHDDALDQVVTRLSAPAIRYPEDS